MSGGLALRYRLAAPALVAQRVVSRLRPPPPGAFRVLLFHDVAPDQRDAFARFARWARDSAGVIGPAEAARRLDGEWPTEGRATPFLFSFDDGFASNGEVARGILDPLGIKALFFVCPGLVDLDRAAQAEAVRANVFPGQAAAVPDGPLMGWDEIRALAVAGHTIGSHGLSHRRLVGIGQREVESEVVGAATRLQEVLGAPAAWYAFTFGDIASTSDFVLSTASRHHRYCRSGVRGLVRPGVSRAAVRAEHIDLDGPDAYRQFVAQGGLDAGYREARARLDAMAAGL